MRMMLVTLMLISPLSFAADIKQELQTQLATLKSFQADFKQRVVDAQDNVLQQSTGKLYVQQPNQLRWEVTAPDETTLIADGSSLWLIDPFAEQVTAMSQNQAVDNNPIVLLTDPTNDAWSSFTYSGELGHYTVTSTNEQSQIQSLTFKFDNNLLTGLTIIDRQQQRSELSFSAQVVNLELDNDLFIFSLPEDFELDDQRTTAGL